MAKRPSMPRPCTLAPAGGPREFQLINVFKHALFLVCAVGKAVVFRVALLQERASEK